MALVGGGAVLPIIAVLYILGFTNLFLRSSLGIMAPGLAREMSLSPQELSMVASSFFFAYAFMQVPTGMLLDRFGPRKTLATMLIFTACGVALFASATSATTLMSARVLMGLGCAGIFTGAFYVLTLWMPADRVVTQTGAMNSFAAFGGLCATTPFAVMLTYVGWRQSYWIFAAGVVVLLTAVALLLRDTPPGKEAPASKGETLGQIFSGVARAFRQPGMNRIIFIGLPLSASSTITGVWGAPYLKDIHGLDSVSQGNMLLGVAVCGMAGHSVYGFLARRFNTVKRLVFTGGLVIVVTTSALAFLEQPPLWMVALLFCAMGLVSAYPMMAFAQARALVPIELVGRGVALTNMGIMSAIALSQLAFGAIIGAFVDGSGPPPEIAYRTAFGMQCAVSLLALALYATVKDAKPRG